MTDQDPRIAEWARADAPEGSPGRAVYREFCEDQTFAWEWSVEPEDRRNQYVRMAAAAIDAQRGKCLWRDDGEAWITRCGHAFTLEEGTPTENAMRYCCYCGRVLKVRQGAERSGR